MIVRGYFLHIKDTHDQKFYSNHLPGGEKKKDFPNSAAVVADCPID